jgi:hypothetical protein
VAPFGRELTDGVHPSEILATVGLDDHRRTNRRRLSAVPREEFFSVAFERDFYQHLREAHR